MDHWLQGIHSKFSNKGRKFSLNMKLNMFAYGILILFSLVIAYLIYSMTSFCNSYNQIVKNITTANTYNLNFREDVDYVMYRMIIGMYTAKEIEKVDDLESPYDLIEEARKVFRKLQNNTTGNENERRVESILKGLNTLEKRVNDIEITVNKPGHYDENINYLDINIYILTELIQDQIQEYIYYEASNMETVRHELEIKEGRVVTTAMVLFLGMIVLTSFVSVLISKSISKPIQTLCGTIEQVAKGNFDTRATITYGDEVSTLTHSFNIMISQIGELVENIKVEQLNLRATELKLLQAQINPHFLYNTLDTIIWLAEDNQSRNVVSMVTSLSDFFRTVLSEGRDFIGIEEEKSHIQSYLEIQQFRYQDILEYEINIPDEIYQYAIIKLTLQPIVENALYHGIKKRRGKGKITVEAVLTEENSIVFTVMDNGIGIEQTQLIQLIQAMKSGYDQNGKRVGFGLANVEERIRLNYGNKYGVYIDSEVGYGTKVTIVIPAILYSTYRTIEGVN